MAAVTRATLTEAVRREVGVPRADAKRFVGAVIEAMTARLAAGEPVKIANFGSFAVRARGRAWRATRRRAIRRWCGRGGR